MKKGGLRAGPIGPSLARLPHFRTSALPPRPLIVIGDDDPFIDPSSSHWISFFHRHKSSERELKKGITAPKLTSLWAFANSAACCNPGLPKTQAKPASLFLFVARVGVSAYHERSQASRGILTPGRCCSRAGRATQAICKKSSMIPGQQGFNLHV
jgi:hypothetical protein